MHFSKIRWRLQIMLPALVFFWSVFLHWIDKLYVCVETPVSETQTETQFTATQDSMAQYALQNSPPSSPHKDPKEPDGQYILKSFQHVLLCIIYLCDIQLYIDKTGNEDANSRRLSTTSQTSIGSQTNLVSMLSQGRDGNASMGTDNGEEDDEESEDEAGASKFVQYEASLVTSSLPRSSELLHGMWYISYHNIYIYV